MVKNIGDKSLFEMLWQSAVKLRGALEPGEYKHPVLGLLFLKYVSDSFVEMQTKLEGWTADPNNEDYYEENEEDRLAIINDRDEYNAENVFWVPENARWEYVAKQAKDTNIAKILDEAMGEIEKANPKVKNLLYRGFSLLKLPPAKFGELIELFSKIGFNSQDHKSADVLGQAYEYFLGKFALAEGKGAGAFYTVDSIVKVLVEILAPHKGQLYEPAIGSAGMVVQSEKFMENHGGERGDISVYGQEYTHTTWKLAAMNLIIRGIDFDLGEANGDTLLNDLHKDLRADFCLANPPFNQGDWGAEKVRGDVRWKYGEPSNSNANYAWIQHMIHHLNDTGRAGIVMPNGVLTSTANNENFIRKGIIEDDLVECIVTLPGKLFINTQIPACLIFLNKDKARKNKTLFIDARHTGQLVEGSRSQWYFSETDIDKIASTYKNWVSSELPNDIYNDTNGFCKSVSTSVIKDNDYVLSSGRYVDPKGELEKEEDFEDEMIALTNLLSEQMSKTVNLDIKIKSSLSEVGYEL